MHTSLFLFTGENTFTLHEELMRWKKTFLTKHGEANFQVLSVVNLKWTDLISELCTAPFLSDKRLVIVEGIPKVEKEEYELLLQEMHPATVLLFSEPSPDKRTGFYKFLLKQATVKTFPLLSRKELITWIFTLGITYHCQISPEVAGYLVDRIGNDQWHLKQEYLKLIAFAAGRAWKELSREGEKGKIQQFYPNAQPTIGDVDTACLPSSTQTVWLLSDLLSRGKQEEAVRFSKELFERGEDPVSLWNIFLWIVRNMITIWAWQNEKPELSVGAIAKEASLPYPTVQSLLPYVKTLSLEKIRNIATSVVEADYALKTGELKSTAGDAVEVMTLLERQLLRLGASENM